MLTQSKSKWNFFSSRLFLFLIGFIMLTITLVIWRADENSRLTNLASQTESLTRTYASESQSQFQIINNALQRMVETEEIRRETNLEIWQKDAIIYTDVYPELSAIAWVNTDFEIQRIIPEEEFSAYLNQKLGDYETADNEIDILLSIDDASEIKGFIFAIVELDNFFAPVVADINNDYMLQIIIEDQNVYQSPNWNPPDQDFLARQPIITPNSGIWTLSLAPTQEMITQEINNARKILLFSLLLSCISFIAVYYAQKYNTVSQVSRLRFQKALEGMMEGYQIISPDLYCLFANDTAAAQFRTNKELMIGHPITEFLPDSQKKKLFPVLQESLEEQNPKQVLQSFDLADGETVWYEISIVPSPDGLFILSYDITDQMQMALKLEEERNLLALRVKDRTAELSRSNTALLKAMQTKDEFLANMSHELRTPLTSIMGLSEILEIGARGPLNEEQLRAIKTIYQSGNHLLTLINDILDLSKIEAGKLDITPEEIVVDDICQASLSLVKGMAFSKSHALTYKLEYPELKAWADTRRLKQILINLLSNAVKFTPDGGEIQLLIQPDKEKNRLLFIVEDNGIGIPDEEKKKLFQAFTQIDGSLSRENEGSGLGLALARNLARLHEGDITLESEGVPGQGSRFTVWLPWQYEDYKDGLQIIPPQLYNKEEHPLLPTQAPQQTADHCILIAEDNPANLDILKDFLENEGYRVLAAQNGKEAVDLTLEHLPYLVLMDIQMPEMDGLTAIRQLRADERTKNIVIYALTALAMPGDRERCLRAGANDYITKPIKFRELLDRLAALFNAAGEVQL